MEMCVTSPLSRRVEHSQEDEEKEQVTEKSNMFQQKNRAAGVDRNHNHA